MNQLTSVRVSLTYAPSIQYTISRASPVCVEYIFMRRMSPAPRKKPAALVYVGAATSAVAANAPSKPRRENLILLWYIVCPTRAPGASICTLNFIIQLFRMSHLDRSAKPHTAIKSEQKYGIRKF